MEEATRTTETDRTRTIEVDLRPLNIGLYIYRLALGTGQHYLEATHEDSYALPRAMLLMMMMMMIE